MLSELKKQVYDANIELSRSGLVLYTWGNVSGIDRELGLVAIKPSGISYSDMKVDDIVVVDLEGNIVDGKLTPSSDTATHLELYKNFSSIAGITHTHSTMATSFAQAGKEIPVLGTTHADNFSGNILCTRKMNNEEIKSNYEQNTGKVIVESINNKYAKTTPGILVRNHGPFTWGKDAMDSVYNSVVLEEVSKMVFYTQIINKEVQLIDSELIDKHYLRKNGKDAYYGQ